ncbi:Glycine-rich domain-containing protein 2 [Carex littledalei]|uniref:Glycine-rich domain-containing protein 2 n=1 Tax=Carex littledalei TaxID=544730 RepID=A0A833RGH8_9POAL|nr:Glycine-rich domain-containing protein 2 [Carex littledalei]
MDKEQEQEEKWNEAQKISNGEDLIEVAQRQIEFLAAVDRNRWLYNSPGGWSGASHLQVQSMLASPLGQA